MNYYIQGNKEKADQIKAAFERNGIDTSANSNCGISNLFYFSCNGEVAVTQNRNTINIIKTHPDYKELELPVEPKFKVGDWIVRWDDAFTVSIKSVRDVNYYFNQGGSLPIKEVDEYYHLWTIQDAKDGDVLAEESCIFIIKKLRAKCETIVYCSLHDDGEFAGGSGLYFDVNSTAPATSVQRNLLFSKMKEAGYTWDVDKKELKKIQPHYDIANFKVGMPVLVREYDTCVWQWVLYSHFNGVGLFFAAGKTWRQCIPFEGNEHLLGTTDMCDEQYINW